MRLIDADAFKAEGRELYRAVGWDLREVHYSQMDVECNIDNMPTIEAEPVKHGRWIDKAAEDCYRCSVCEEYTHMEMPRLLYHYCPNCGAKMFDKDTDVPDKNVGKMDEVDND